MGEEGLGDSKKEKLRSGGWDYLVVRVGEVCLCIGWLHQFHV